MANIIRNQFGGITINNRVLEKLIVEDMLEMKDMVMLCSRKGKIIKNKPTPFIDPDYYDAIELNEKKNHISVKIYAVASSGQIISEVSDKIFEKVETVFRTVGLEKPDNITVAFKGIRGDEVNRRNIEVTRNNG